MTIGLATFLRPFVLLVLLVVIVRPLARRIHRALPEGRLREILFRERTNETASSGDKWTMVVAVLVGYAFLVVVGLIAAKYLT